MTIKGIGTDIIEVKRLKNVIKRKGNAFLEKVFTKKEIEYCQKFKKNPYPHLAARFAAKEALSKALGIGLGKISFLDIEITNDSRGKPIIELSSSIKKEFNNPTILLSISHTEIYALATVIYS
ncbi:MAG: holo-ACP synthase [Parachlamydiales bacterium]|nr:holo-ACP synthase [Parachlamydiales bacterium]